MTDKQLPHEAYMASKTVVLHDADGREVPAELLEGPDDDGDYLWRIKGECRLHKGGCICPADAEWYFKADGTFVGESDVHLIVKDEMREVEPMPRAPQFSKVLQILEWHQASDELIAEMRKLFAERDPLADLADRIGCDAEALRNHLPELRAIIEGEG